MSKEISLTEAEPNKSINNGPGQHIEPTTAFGWIVYGDNLAVHRLGYGGVLFVDESSDDYLKKSLQRAIELNEKTSRYETPRGDAEGSVATGSIVGLAGAAALGAGAFIEYDGDPVRTPIATGLGGLMGVIGYYKHKIGREFKLWQQIAREDLLEQHRLKLEGGAEIIPNGRLPIHRSVNRDGQVVDPLRRWIEQGVFNLGDFTVDMLTSDNNPVELWHGEFGEIIKGLSKDSSYKGLSSRQTLESLLRAVEERNLLPDYRQALLQASQAALEQELQLNDPKTSAEIRKSIARLKDSVNKDSEPDMQT